MRKDITSKQHDLDVARQNGELDNADYSEQQDALQKENDQQFKALLGDERYAAMENPDSEGEMRRSLQGLNISDTQFESMLETQRKWNEQQVALEQDTKTDEKSKEQQMQALDAARDAEYQRVLGSDAFSELQKSQDSSYQTLKQNAKVWDLSDSDIDSVYKALQYSQKSISDYQQQAQDMEDQGQSVDWEKVQQNIQQFSDQTQQSLQTYLGEDRFNKLKKNGLFNSSEN
ncbi:MAG TPA: hypothetical protein VK810_05750 [Dongiaceae bacterium]|nr:hypothetical protein [Dongiaceae bacterium]